MKPEINLNLLAEKVKEKRGEMTLNDAANQIGKISGTTVSRIESGKITDLNTFVRVCRWLGCSSDEFIVVKHRIKHPEIKPKLKVPCKRCNKKEAVSLPIQGYLTVCDDCEKFLLDALKELNRQS